MNKELESLYTPLQSLNNIRYNYFHDKGGSELEYFWFNRVEDELKQQENDIEVWRNYLKEIKNLPHIEVQMKLKGFDIINKKNVCIHDFKKSKTLEEYNDCREWEEQLTQEDFDLLKELLYE